jgi:exodeoxyribonuclease V gamma subunit
VRWLALTAAYPERPIAAVTVGRLRFGASPDRSATTAIARLEPVDPEPAARARFAHEQLATLIEVYDRGMREPLPLPCLTSAAYAEAVRSGANAEREAAKEWTSEWNFDHEDRDPEHEYVFGAAISFEELLAKPLREEELQADPTRFELSRFGSYSRRLWDGLLAAEQVTYL